MYTIKHIIDWIFPPSPNEAYLRTWSTEEFIDLLKVEHHKSNTLSLSQYSHPAIRAAIQATKFEQSYLAATLLGQLVAHYLVTTPKKKTLLIPIPLSNRRERKRGFNQVARVIEYAIKQNDNTITTSAILKRPKDTAPQTTLKRSERLKNVAGIFTVHEQALIQTINQQKIERVIICDDVYTTGATMNEARAQLIPLLPAQVELICVAWAH